MSGRSNSFKNSILLSTLNGGGNLYVRLYTDAQVLSDSVLGTETTYGGYPVRGVAVPANSENWLITANQAVNGLISFPTATSGSDVIKYFAIWKNNTSDNEADRLYWGQLTIDKSVVVGKPFTFQPGAIVITEN